MSRFPQHTHKNPVGLEGLSGKFPSGKRSLAFRIQALAHNQVPMGRLLHECGAGEDPARMPCGTLTRLYTQLQTPLHMTHERSDHKVNARVPYLQHP